MKQDRPDWLRFPLMFTKDSGRGELAHRKPGDIARYVHMLADNHARAFRLSIMWGGEVFYQSDLAQRVPGLGEIDYLREALDASRERGTKLIAYFNPNAIWHESPFFPDCAIKNCDGEVWKINSYGKEGWYYPCINHPRYRQYILKMLEEVFTKYGPDGSYFDGLTPHICYCEYCKQGFKDFCGKEIPKVTSPHCVMWEMTSHADPVGDPGDPAILEYTKWLEKCMADITREVRETVRRCKPDAVTTFHSFPKLDSIRYYDATLDEIYVTKPWRYDLWKTGELASYGNVFDGLPVWLNIYLHGTEQNNVMGRHKIIQTLANGCVPNAWREEGMAEMFAFAERNADYYDVTKTRPVKFLALPRSIAHDALQRQVAVLTSLPLAEGDQNLLKISEREPNGKLDLICIRRDGREPTDDEFKSSTGPTRDVIYIQAEAFDEALSVRKTQKARWEIREGDGAFGKYVTSSQHTQASSPVTSLVYRLPAIAKGPGQWVLWARAVFPNSGSDSFFYQISSDNGATWTPAEASEDYAVGWEQMTEWRWVRGRQGSPTTKEGIDRFLSPYTGCYAALLHSRLPVVTIHRNQIADRLSGFRVLCLANEVCLSNEQIDAIKKFVAAGGGLIATHETSLYDGEARPRGEFGLSELFGADYVLTTTPPNTVVYGEAGEGAGPYLKPSADHPVVARLDAEPAIPNREAMAIVRLKGNAKAVAAMGAHPAIVGNEYGKGRVVYIAARLDSTYSYWMYPGIRRIYENAVRWVAADRIPVEVRTEAPIGVTLFDQPSRRIVHLVNYSIGAARPIPSFTPVKNVPLSVKVPSGKKVKDARLLMANTAAPFREGNGRVEITVPALREYEVVAIELQ